MEQMPPIGNARSPPEHWNSALTWRVRVSGINMERVRRREGEREGLWLSSKEGGLDYLYRKWIPAAGAIASYVAVEHMCGLCDCVSLSPFFSPFSFFSLGQYQKVHRPDTRVDTEHHHHQCVCVVLSGTLSVCLSGASPAPAVSPRREEEGESYCVRSCLNFDGGRGDPSIHMHRET